MKYWIFDITVILIAVALLIFGAMGIEKKIIESDRYRQQQINTIRQQIGENQAVLKTLGLEHGYSINFMVEVE